jgi:hypothetical protein
MMPRTRLGLVLLLVPAAVLAQSTGDQNAFTALSGTHIGALTPLMSPAMIRRTLNGSQLAIRYGLRDEPGIRSHAIAGTALFAVGLESSVALTAGVADADCATCSPKLLLGAGGDMRIFERGDVLAAGSSFTLAVSGDIGYGQPPSVEHAFALGVGAPATLVFGATREGMRVATFFTPVFGIGNISAGCPVIPGAQCENSGTRFVLGGGIGLWNPLSSVSASLGVNQVMLTNARPVFGVNVILGGR